MSRDTRTIAPTATPAMFQQQVASLFDRPRAEARITAGAEAANVRRFTIQVVDRMGKEWGRRWLVQFWTTDTASGAPSGSHTLAFVAGTAIQTIAANQHYLAETDANGKIVVDLTVAGVSSRWVKACVVEQINDSGEVAWA